MPDSFDFDVVIIGSGFGGSINACRLSAAGQRVLVLERGRWWKPPAEDNNPVDMSQFPAGATPYPRRPEDPWIWSVDDPEKHNGWIEFHFWPHMAVATAAGVGGGSLVYANVSAIPPAITFEQGWPTGIDRETLLPYYELAGKVLDVQELPDNQLTRRFQLVKEGAEAIGDGDRFGKLPLAVTFSEDWHYGLKDPFDNSHTQPFTNAFGHAQGTCVHCGNCDVGCQVLAKNTLDLNYLWQAQQQGTEVRALCMVSHVAPEGDGYRVHYSTLDPDNDSSTEGFSVTGRRVILAAGSLGSTELLLRSRDQFGTLPDVSEALGGQWSANGDYLTPAWYSKREPPPSPTWGPTITCHIDYLVDQPEGEPRYTIEDGGAPPALRDWLVQAIEVEEGKVADKAIKMALQHLANMITDDNEFDKLMPWFANGVDAGTGVLELKDGKLFLDWDVKKSKPTYDAEIHKQVELAHATGGAAQVPISWWLFHWLITPHPVGGSRMGNTAAEGVVDHAGRVFGYPGLYVSDGSIIPTPIGINPSRTISALSERIAAIMIDEIQAEAAAKIQVPAIFGEADVTA
ncbi:MAG: GMC oxidoreductase [Longimicrobiaceae bacterium]